MEIIILFQIFYVSRAVKLHDFDEKKRKDYKLFFAAFFAMILI